jgi:ABC-type sugar transport system permease subunit
MVVGGGRFGRVRGLGRRSARRRRDALTFLAFTGPALVLFAVFTYWPILYTAALSLTRWNLLTPQAEFVGLENYGRLFTDPLFWRVFINTTAYAVGVVAIAEALAFLLALLLNRDVPGRPIFRTLAFTPYVTMTAAAAVVWVLLLDPRLGPLSRLYAALGVAGPDWLASSTLALPAVMQVGIWKEVGIASVFFLAGLQGLPRECYEAARVDGSSGLGMLRHITLPLMTPVIFFLLVSGFIAATKTFETVAIMTEGGPVYPASSTYVYHLYRLAFVRFQAGYASAFAVVFLLLTVAATVLQFRLARVWVHDEDRP